MNDYWAAINWCSMDSNLQLIAAQYLTRLTEFTFDGTDRQLVLESNPNRWYIQFFIGQGAGDQKVFPGPADVVINISTGPNVPIDWKFRDCPSIVTGEFYGNGMVGTTVIIVECIYLRG